MIYSPPKWTKINTCKLLCCSDKSYYYPLTVFRTSEKKFAALWPTHIEWYVLHTCTRTHTSTGPLRGHACVGTSYGTLCGVLRQYIPGPWWFRNGISRTVSDRIGSAGAHRTLPSSGRAVKWFLERFSMVPSLRRCAYVWSGTGDG